MLDSLYDTARRLEERLITVERIVAADHPDFKPTTSGAGRHRSRRLSQEQLT
jgi:hypothetical protein